MYCEQSVAQHSSIHLLQILFTTAATYSLIHSSWWKIYTSNKVAHYIQDGWCVVKSKHFFHRTGLDTFLAPTETRPLSSVSSDCATTAVWALRAPSEPSELQERPAPPPAHSISWLHWRPLLSQFIANGNTGHRTKHFVRSTGNISWLALRDYECH